MNNVTYEQYDSQQYPLKRFYCREIPREIEDVLMRLCHAELAVFRGGLAFVYLMNEREYLLKDLDMLALEVNTNNILMTLSGAETVFVNKNTFGDNVITAFWKSENEYYKLDILLCREMPDLCRKVFDDKEVTTVSASYIWRNRIEKIAEKEIRKHDDKKTLNHYKVVRTLSDYLTEHRDEIDESDARIVESKLNAVKIILSSLIEENYLKNFIRIQSILVRSGENENIVMPAKEPR